MFKMRGGDYYSDIKNHNSVTTYPIAYSNVHFNVRNRNYERYNHFI